MLHVFFRIKKIFKNANYNFCSIHTILLTHNLQDFVYKRHRHSKIHTDTCSHTHTLQHNALNEMNTN